MNTNWNDPDFQGFARKNPFAGKPKREKKPRKAIGSPLGRTVLNLAVTLVFAAVFAMLAVLSVGGKKYAERLEV